MDLPQEILFIVGGKETISLTAERPAATGEGAGPTLKTKIETPIPARKS